MMTDVTDPCSLNSDHHDELLPVIMMTPAWWLMVRDIQQVSSLVIKHDINDERNTASINTNDTLDDETATDGGDTAEGN